MPYGYYQLVRFIALIAFTFLSYTAYQKHSEKVAIIYAVLALLFQPLVKIALGRQLWNVIDVLVGVVLLFSIATHSKMKADF
jgi:hypothetical protein